MIIVVICGVDQLELVNLDIMSAPCRLLLLD